MSRPEPIAEVFDDIVNRQELAVFVVRHRGNDSRYVAAGNIGRQDRQAELCPGGEEEQATLSLLVKRLGFCAKPAGRCKTVHAIRHLERAKLLSAFHHIGEQLVDVVMDLPELAAAYLNHVGGGSTSLFDV